MKRFIEGIDRSQSTLFPECLEDWIDEDNPVRVIDVFVNELDLGKLGFGGVDPEITGRPSYHPSVLLKPTSTGISTAFSRAVGLSARLYAMSRSCGLRVGLLPITRRLPTFVGTTAAPSSKFALDLSRCAARWVF